MAVPPLRRLVNATEGAVAASVSRTKDEIRPFDPNDPPASELDGLLFEAANGSGVFPPKPAQRLAELIRDITDRLYRLAEQDRQRYIPEEQASIVGNDFVSNIEETERTFASVQVYPSAVFIFMGANVAADGARVLARTIGLDPARVDTEKAGVPVTGLSLIRLLDSLAAYFLVAYPTLAQDAGFAFAALSSLVRFHLESPPEDRKEEAKYRPLGVIDTVSPSPELARTLSTEAKLVANAPQFWRFGFFIPLAATTFIAFEGGDQESAVRIARERSRGATTRLADFLARGGAYSLARGFPEALSYLDTFRAAPEVAARRYGYLLPVQETKSVVLSQVQRTRFLETNPETQETVILPGEEFEPARLYSRGEGKEGGGAGFAETALPALGANVGPARSASGGAAIPLVRGSARAQAAVASAASTNPALQSMQALATRSLQTGFWDTSAVTSIDRYRLPGEVAEIVDAAVASSRRQLTALYTALARVPGSVGATYFLADQYALLDGPQSIAQPLNSSRLVSGELRPQSEAIAAAFVRGLRALVNINASAALPVRSLPERVARASALNSRAYFGRGSGQSGAGSSRGSSRSSSSSTSGGGEQVKQEEKKIVGDPLAIKVIARETPVWVSNPLLESARDPLVLWTPNWIFYTGDLESCRSVLAISADPVANETIAWIGVEVTVPLKTINALVTSVTNTPIADVTALVDAAQISDFVYALALYYLLRSDTSPLVARRLAALSRLRATSSTLSSINPGDPGLLHVWQIAEGSQDFRTIFIGVGFPLALPIVTPNSPSDLTWVVNNTLSALAYACPAEVEAVLGTSREKRAETLAPRTASLQANNFYSRPDFLVK